MNGVSLPSPSWPRVIIKIMCSLYFCIEVVSRLAVKRSIDWRVGGPGYGWFLEKSFEFGEKKESKSLQGIQGGWPGLNVT